MGLIVTPTQLNIAMTGAWSLVPTSFCTWQLAARSARVVLAST
jgi:hypothetical protein